MLAEKFDGGNNVMGKFDRILLCSDLDGTLTDESGAIPEKNIRALEYFCSEGGKFCISTGRLPAYLLEHYFSKEFLSGCPTICCNGACIYDFAEEKVLLERPFTSHCVELAEFLYKNCADIIRLTISTRGPLIVNFDDYSASYDKIRAMLADMPIYKVVLVFDDDNEEGALSLKSMLEKSFGEYFNFSRSWATGLEILDAHATKGDAVHALKKILGNDMVAVCAGNYENDITMLTAADIGCAVSDSVPSLKEAADKIVCSSREGAIAYIVDNVLDWI